ncbi:hypothetical protein KKC88_06310 [Patescibacteria group bacterium]|nr:hypothetical protein [Patescibacteria group bacterium]MBU1673905.1 hypothetical protein [Patescibacteria group bacterium]MBU1963422.1 hypothetical protein [Patescibacteria group bacterium]
MLSQKIVEKIRVDGLTISTSLLVHAAKKNRLIVKLLPEKALSISNDSGREFFFKETMFPCNDSVAARLSDNKYFVRQLLQAENVAVPKTKILDNAAAWEKTLKSRHLSFPLVVKPLNAAHGHGITVKIMRKSVLREAVKKAFKLTREVNRKKRILVEEYFEGHDLRFLTVGNKVISVVERKPAYVVGNGEDNIRKLIKNYNQVWRSRISQYDMPLCPILIDSEVTRRLSLQNLKIDSLLKKGQVAHLRFNANVSTGGRTFDVTDEVSPALKKLALKCMDITKLQVAGVDMLCKDIKSSDTTYNNLCILEVNDEPGLDIHYFPFQGKSRDIGTAILKHIFKVNS